MKRAKFRWRDLGPIKVKTPLDNVPKQSGVYKLTFHLWGKTYAHIGEAGARGLRARIRDYANNPTEGNKVEHLLHDLLKEAGEAQLSVCCIGVDEQKARRQFEKEEAANAVQQGLMCINKAGCRDDLRRALPPPNMPPAEWSRWTVSLRLAVALAWPAEPVGVAQPASCNHIKERSRSRVCGPSKCILLATAPL
jgi:hypothetical protein